jgi:hypothetical protein
MSIDAISTVALWMIIPLGILGSLLHFAFDWAKHNRIMAIFAAVNESYWEHIKIAVWPVFCLQVILFALGGFNHPSFIPAAAASVYSIPILMIGLVFLYKLISKRNILWIDITSFFAVVAVSQVIFSNVLIELKPSLPTIVLSSLLFVGLFAAFLKFTLHPPKEPDFFIDPTNSKYGLLAHPDIPEGGSSTTNY